MIIKPDGYIYIGIVVFQYLLDFIVSALTGIIGDNIVYEMEVPGVNKEDISIEVEHDEKDLFSKKSEIFFYSINKNS